MNFVVSYSKKFLVYILRFILIIWLSYVQESGNVKKKRVYLKTLSKQVGGGSRHLQKNFSELIFDIMWGQIPF